MKKQKHYRKRSLNCCPPVTARGVLLILRLQYVPGNLAIHCGDIHLVAQLKPYPENPFVQPCKHPWSPILQRVHTVY